MYYGWKPLNGETFLEVEPAMDGLTRTLVGGENGNDRATDLRCQKCFKVKTVSLFGGAGDVHSGRGKRVMAVKSYGAITQYGRSQRGGQPTHSPLLIAFSLLLS